MSRPRLLDLFCGAGGCSVGYHRAGFDVTGIDIEGHPTYPYEMRIGDAVDVLADVDYLRTFDVIHASPPCHDHSALRAVTGADGTGGLLEGTLAALKRAGIPWVVENVGTARPLRGELMLCGSMFGLGATCADGVWRQLRRHRLFASSEFLVPPATCMHAGRGRYVGVHGGGTAHASVSVVGHGRNRPRVGARRGWQASKAEAVEAMGIDWMTRDDIVQAIPPAYTEWIGGQILEPARKVAS